MPRTTSRKPRSAVAAPAAPRGARAIAEWLVHLALAVTLFRCFGIEGYMISTGSMAPCLLGYHLRADCPACGLPVVRSAAPPRLGAIETGVRRAVAQAVGEVAVTDPLVCPNCGRLCSPDDVAARSEGDQLLVHKDAFAWRVLAGRGGPRRWEIALFRNPEDPRIAYVKRVAGLPNESIELIDGDVYADGRLQRKPLEAQLSCRVPVARSDAVSHDGDPDWQPRWVRQPGASGWRVEETRFVYERDAGERHLLRRGDDAAWDWLTYRHWIRSGGSHRTEVPLERWPDDVPPPNELLSQLDYDAERRVLICTGALPAPERERWESATTDRALQDAIWELYRESHVAPITDELAYNPPGMAGTHPVRDLMVELTLQWRGGSGVFAIEIGDGAGELRSEFDFGRGEVRLQVARETLGTAALAIPRGSRVVVLMSNFDRQLLVACDGVPVCEPVPYERDGPIVPLRRPIRLGAQDADLIVEQIAVYRDVHYTPAASGRKEFQLGDSEYFLLGDNSAVSIDSRHWSRPGVPLSAFVGKPLVVHLPSRPLRLEWGGSVRQIRVPDLSRIRYIR